MLLFENTVISSDVIQEAFVCDLQKCKGACCVAGDLGAPLERDELAEIEAAAEVVRPYLSDAHLRVLDQDGAFVLDEEGDMSTTTVNGQECVFVYYDHQGIAKCSIEQAWKEGKTGFRKPISCHLYPIRIKKLGDFDALNYDKWSICSPACDLGAHLKVPVYRFLREALIRKYGESWYAELEKIIADAGDQIK